MFIISYQTRQCQSFMQFYFWMNNNNNFDKSFFLLIFKNCANSISNLFFLIISNTNILNYKFEYGYISNVAKCSTILICLPHVSIRNDTAFVDINIELHELCHTTSGTATDYNVDISLCII